MGQLSFTPGDATWSRLRDRGKADLYFLADVILGYGDKIPMRKHAHELLCRIAQGKTGCPEIDTAPIQKLLLPRKWGKTCIITVSGTIQRLINDPNCSTLICNEREETARDFLSEIKSHFMRNELFRALYPEVIPSQFGETTWSASRINVQRTTTRKDPSVFVIGVGGTVTGMHPDFIDVDDMISREAAENARRGSWQIMEEVNRWTHTLKDLLSGNPRFAQRPRTRFTGTRWFFNDCYDHLDEYFGGGELKRTWLLTVPVENGVKQTFTVTRQGDLVEYRRSKIEEGRASWAERWDMEEMAREQLGDPILFSANALNNPSSEASATFKPDWLKTFTWLDNRTVRYIDPKGVTVILQVEQLDKVLLVDPGGFGKGIEDRARSAIVVVGHTPTGEYLLLETWSERDTYVACQQRIMELARRYMVRKVGIEQAGQQVVFVDQTRKLLQDAKIPVAIEPLATEGRHKDDRILALEPYFQRGLVYIGTGSGFTEFRTQYSQFPRTARRDLLDALAYLPKMVRPRAAPQQSRQEAELVAYYKRRNLAPPRRAS